MVTKYYDAGAAKVAKSHVVTVGGTIDTDDLFILTIGDKSLSVTGGSTDAATVADAIVAAYNLLASDEYPEFFEVAITDGTSGTYTLAAKDAIKGLDFTVTATTTEAGGGAADLQTHVLSAASPDFSGPQDWGSGDRSKENWSDDVVPITGDTAAIENIDVLITEGLDQSAVTLAVFDAKQSFTGELGRPFVNRSGSADYPEYRPTYLAVGATLCDIGEGEGAGSSRVMIDYGSVQTACVVHNSGRRHGDTPELAAVILKGTHASNTLDVRGSADVMIAPFTGEVSTFATLNVSDSAQVICGLGVTLTTVNITGGVTDIDLTTAAITTINVKNGLLRLRGDGNGVTTINIESGGRVDDLGGSGTIVTVNVFAAGEYDHSQSQTGREITNINLNHAFIYKDPYGAVTKSAGKAEYNFIGTSSGDRANTFITKIGQTLAEP